MSAFSQASAGGSGATALVSRDWSSFTPPYRDWDRSLERLEARAERRIDDAVRTARTTGALASVSPAWLSFLRVHTQVSAFMSKATARVLADASARCPWPAIARCLHVAALTHERQAVSLVLHGSDLEVVAGAIPIEEARSHWHEDERWRDTRDALSRIAATSDWSEALLAVNLCFEPFVGVLLRREYGIAAARAFGDPVTPALGEAGQLEYDWACDWTIALVRFLVEDPDHGPANRRVITDWLAAWEPHVERAAAGAALLGREVMPSYDPDAVLARLRGERRRLLAGAELPVVLG